MQSFCTGAQTWKSVMVGVESVKLTCKAFSAIVCSWASPMFGFCPVAMATASAASSLASCSLVRALRAKEASMTPATSTTITGMSREKITAT